MNVRSLLLLVAALSLPSASPVRAEDAAANSPAAAPAKAAPAAAASTAAPAASAPVAAPAAPSAATPAASTPAAAPAAPTSAAKSAPAPAAAAPVAAAAKAVVNAATYTRDIGMLYDDMTKEAQQFTANNETMIQSFKQKEADFEAQLDAVNKEYEEKSKDPEVKKQTHWWGSNPVLSPLKKQAKQLTNDLENARKETKRQTQDMLDSMWAMERKHMDAIKAKYNEVDGLVKAAENQ